MAENRPVRVTFAGTDIDLRVATSSRFSGLFRNLKRLFLILLLANLGYILMTRWVNPPLTLTMAGSVIRGHGLTRDAIPYARMGRQAKLAVICAEDQLFADHNGFDWNAIRQAMKYNENPKHRKVRGASTISQQTAKNVFLWNGRNWFRKGLEVYHTFMIEWIWGKKRILETYLNVAEMGKGIFGIQAAARHYFNKDAGKLSRSEAAWIAAILPNPVVYSIEKPNGTLIRRHAWIMRQMENLDDDPDLAALLKEE